MQKKFNGLIEAKGKLRFRLSFEVILVSLIILLPSIELFSTIFRGVISSFLLIFLWLVIYFLRGYSQRIKVIREYSLIFIVLGGVYLALFFHYGLSFSGKEGLLHFLGLLHLGCIFFICVYYSGNFERDLSLRFSVFLIILSVLCFFSILSIPYIFNNDVLVIRHLASGQLTSSQEFEARKNGLGTNGLYSSLPMIIVFSLALIKSFKLKRSVRNLILLSIIPLSVSILISTFFASVGLLVFALFYYFYVGNKSKSFVLLLKISVFLSLGYFILYFFLLDLELFKPILDKFERFNEVGGDDTGRTRLAANSLASFYKSPLVGIGVPEKGSYHLIGEHMPWVDFLGQYGIIISGLIYFVFVLLFKKIFKQSRVILSTPLNQANKVVFVLFIVGNFISPMIYYPLSYCLLFLCGIPILDKNKL